MGQENPIAINPSNRVRRTGDKMTGPLIINPADGADPLFQVETTGTNQYGWEVGTYDLTGVGFGKYGTLIPRSNGLIGDGLGLIEGGVIIGDDVVSGIFGQSIGFLQKATISSMLITADWDWDGLGNNRMVFNDDVLYQEDCEVTGTLTAGTLSLASLSIGRNAEIRPTIDFDAINYDGEFVFHDSGGGVPVRWELHNTGGLSDVWIDRGLGMYGNSGLTKIEFENSQSGGSGNVYADYNDGVTGYGDYISHEFQHLATNMEDSAYMMRLFNMNNPGYMFGIKSRGSLELGSTTGTDGDISITFNGGGTGNHGLFTWDESEDEFVFADDVSISGNLDVTSFTTPYTKTVTISPAGGDYTTIQSALDANTSGSELFIVYPGTYTNDTINFTANNQCVRNAGKPNTTIVTNASQIVEVGDYTNCSIVDMNLQFNPTTAINGIEVNDGSVTLLQCKITLTTSTNIVQATQPSLLATTGTGTLRTKLGEQYYYHTGDCGATAIKTMLSTATGSSIIILRSCRMWIVNSGTALASTIFVNAGTGDIDIENACDIKVEDDTATIVAGLGYVGGSGDDMATHSSLTVIGGGSNTCYGLYNDGTGSFRSSHNNITVTSGTANYAAYVGASATLIGHMDDVVAADGNAGTGTVNLASSLADGEFTTTGDLTAGGLARVAMPYIHLEKTSTQNTGGANGTETYMTWETQTHIDTDVFTHSTSSNTERIYVDEDGVYTIIATIGITQGGAARTTTAARFRIDGSTKVLRGGLRNYSCGSGYGDMSAHLNTQVALTSGQYIEVYTWIDDTDASYTQNTINAECEVIMRKVA